MQEKQNWKHQVFSPELLHASRLLGRWAMSLFCKRCCWVSSYNKCSRDSAIHSQLDLASVRGYQEDSKSNWDCGYLGPSNLRQSLWGRLEPQRSLRWSSAQAGNFSQNFQPSIHNWKTAPRRWFARYLHWIRDNRRRFSLRRPRRRRIVRVHKRIY